MKVFDQYSLYYNLLYRDKDYDAESSYILQLIKTHKSDAISILDVGCGTGKHAHLMSKHKFKVSGIDLSESMLNQAQTNYPNLTFYHGDARNFKLNHKFDIITSLFHVASYQTSNDDFNNYLSTINQHLTESGIFIFDFWYGPAVLEEKPEVRIKRMEAENLLITRLAEPVLHVNENLVDVNYQILIKDKNTNLLNELYETHKMRYWFMPEIKQALDFNGFDFVMCHKWMSNQQPSENSWSVCVIARRKC